jgi:hypothetical protein
MVVWSAMIRHQMFDLAAELRSAIFVGVGVLLGLGVAMLWSQLGIAP